MPIFSFAILVVLAFAIILLIEMLFNPNCFASSSSSSSLDKYPVIPFSLFAQSYALNPDSWELYHNYVAKKINQCITGNLKSKFPNCAGCPLSRRGPSTSTSSPSFYCDYSRKIYEEHYTFSKYDIFHYHRWCKELKKLEKAKAVQEKIKSDTNHVDILLKTIQIEINAMTAKSGSELNTAREVAEKVSQTSPSVLTSVSSSVSSASTSPDPVPDFPEHLVSGNRSHAEP